MSLMQCHLTYIKDAGAELGFKIIKKSNTIVYFKFSAVLQLKIKAQGKRYYIGNFLSSLRPLHLLCILPAFLYYHCRSIAKCGKFKWIVSKGNDSSPD